MKNISAALLALGAVALVACDRNEPVTEDTIEEIEDAADDAGDAAEEVVDEVGDNFEDPPQPNLKGK